VLKFCDFEERGHLRGHLLSPLCCLSAAILVVSAFAPSTGLHAQLGGGVRQFVVDRRPGCVSNTSQTRVYDEAGNVIATHEHASDFKEW
jgi:hypothetical protein